MKNIIKIIILVNVIFSSALTMFSNAQSMVDTSWIIKEKIILPLNVKEINNLQIVFSRKEGIIFSTGKAIYSYNNGSIHIINGNLSAKKISVSDKQELLIMNVLEKYIYVIEKNRFDSIEIKNAKTWYLFQNDIISELIGGRSYIPTYYYDSTLLFPEFHNRFGSRFNYYYNFHVNTKDSMCYQILDDVILAYSPNTLSVDSRYSFILPGVESLSSDVIYCNGKTQTAIYKNDVGDLIGYNASSKKQFHLHLMYREKNPMHIASMGEKSAYCFDYTNETIYGLYVEDGKLYYARWMKGEK
jgi:hypothetical protein